MTGSSMSLSVPVAELLPTVVERLVNGFSPLRIIVFGSQARGTAGQDSDLDLLVVMPDGTAHRETRIAMRRVLRDLPLAKDILVTTPHEIARRGQIPGLVLHTALAEGAEVYAGK